MSNATKNGKQGLFIGLMSGTSADALDAVLVHISNGGCRWLNAVSLPIKDSTRQLIHQLATAGPDEINLLHRVEQAITELSSLAVEQLCQKAGITSADVVAIGSHGQTIRHKPASQQPGFSLQVGDANAMAQTTGITTIADFRRRDIALGGQGAPLVPAFHQAVFQADTPRAIINIGGVANISWLGNTKTQGFDVGPGNNLMDSWCQTHYQIAYDSNGALSEKGEVNTALLAILLEHPFYAQAGPKSTGRELFNLDYVNNALQKLDTQPANIDVLTTLAQLTSSTITNIINKLDPHQQASVYICGGGALNKALMNRLQKDLAPRNLDSTEPLGLHPQWVEGAAFAWLAYRCINGLTGNLPSVTGASKKCILGGIYQA